MTTQKRKYVAGLAQLKFKPSFDWTYDEAKSLYESAFNKETLLSTVQNTINYNDCIRGMQQMPAASVDLIVADPPFGIDRTAQGSQYNRDSSLVVNDYNEISDHYDTFSLSWIKELPRLMKFSTSAYILSGWTHLNEVLTAIEEAKLTVVNHCIWKYQFGVFAKNKFVSSHYHILFVVKDENHYFFNKYEAYPEDVFLNIQRTYAPGQQKNSTKLPEALITRMINFSSKPGDLVFDPFMGNGTTAVCAKGWFRRYFGFEINIQLRTIHEQTLQETTVGSYYKPLKTFLPTVADLLKKYPHLKKYVEERKNE